MERDRDARFLTLVETYGRALQRLAAGYERDASRRQDLEQDVYLALWQALPSFAGHCSERTFVFRVAHNRAVSHVRHWRIRQSDALTSTDEPVAAEASPEQSFADNERRAALMTAVHALPLSLRQVMLLLLEGSTQKEIADVLGISEANVATRALRARRALASALGSGVSP